MMALWSLAIRMCHALNPRIVTELAFYKTWDFVYFKIIFIFKRFRICVKSLLASLEIKTSI